MMTNQLIANKIKEDNYEKILSLAEQTKNLFPKKIGNKSNTIKKIILKIKLKSPIKRIRINKYNKCKTKEFNNLSKMDFENDIENYKSNIGIINFKEAHQKNYYIRSNKLIDNISNLNNSYNDKSKILPNIDKSKLRNKSLVQTHADLNLKKIYLGDLSKNIEENDIDNSNIKIENKIIPDYIKINKNKDKIKLKKLLLMRNTTDYKFANKNNNTDKSHRNAKLLKKYYQQKIMNYDKLIKKMEKESELKINIMNEYINLMKQNLEQNFEA